MADISFLQSEINSIFAGLRSVLNTCIDNNGPMSVLARDVDLLDSQESFLLSSAEKDSLDLFKTKLADTFWEAYLLCEKYGRLSDWPEENRQEVLDRFHKLSETE